MSNCASYCACSAECFSHSSPLNPATKAASATPNKPLQDGVSASTDAAAQRREHALHVVNGRSDVMARSPVRLVGGTRRLSNVVIRNGRERGKRSNPRDDKGKRYELNDIVIQKRYRHYQIIEEHWKDSFPKLRLRTSWICQERGCWL